MTDEFFIGKHRIVPTESGGFWVYPRGGARGRFYGPDSPVSQSIRSGCEAVDPEIRARAFKTGTIEPVYYIRDSEGKAGVPPVPGLDVPEGCTLHEARSLQEIDALAREMNRDLFEGFYDDGTATRLFDKLLGDPLKTLRQQLEHPVSRMERDVIPLLIQDLEDMERRNREVHTEIHFRHRES